MRPVNKGPRIRREKRAIAAMFAIYCQDHHTLGRKGPLCGECDRLLRYAHRRLDHCVFGDLKSPCAQCAVDCYSKSQRPAILAVIDYAGPRLRWRYPALAFSRLLDKLRAR
ncbi:MAG: nitrous oxide-stimulated promoter family protein [Halochromatium sp.]